MSVTSIKFQIIISQYFLYLRYMYQNRHLEICYFLSTCLEICYNFLSNVFFVCLGNCLFIYYYVNSFLKFDHIYTIRKQLYSDVKMCRPNNRHKNCVDQTDTNLSRKKWRVMVSKPTQQLLLNKKIIEDVSVWPK